MHELKIATYILNITDSVALNHKLTKINTINVKIGKMRHIYQETLKNAFKIVSEDTKAKDATLQLELIPIKMRCRSCEEVFLVKSNSYICNFCGEYDLETVEGDEIIIESIDGEQ